MATERNDYTHTNQGQYAQHVETTPKETTVCRDS